MGILGTVDVIRPFVKTDYPAFVALYNRCRPEAPESKASVREFDSAYADDELLNLVAVQGAELIGAVWAHRDQAGERQVRLEMLAEPVMPLAETLYRTALEKLGPYRPSALIVRVRENWTDWRDFYGDKEFAELERMWESRLELSTFSPERFKEATARIADSGITLGTLADLPDMTATQRRLYETITQLLSDVPVREPLNIWPFELWQKRFWKNPARRPESYFLAFDGEAIVGVSELRAASRSDWLSTGLTGVKRAYRRQGVALALKVRAAQYAKTAGFAVISTQNHTTNRAMLGINEALGFVKEPAWLRLKKTLETAKPD